MCCTHASLGRDALYFIQDCVGFVIVQLDKITVFLAAARIGRTLAIARILACQKASCKWRPGCYADSLILAQWHEFDLDIACNKRIICLQRHELFPSVLFGN